MAGIGGYIVDGTAYIDGVAYTSAVSVRQKECSMILNFLKCVL